MIITLEKRGIVFLKMYNKTANEYMASMSLGMLILNIDIYDGTPSTQIGPLMGMESTSLSRSLSNLEERGIITRERDSLDKRKSIIRLTKYGIESERLQKRQSWILTTRLWSTLKRKR